MKYCMTACVSCSNLWQRRASQPGPWLVFVCRAFVCLCVLLLRCLLVCFPPPPPPLLELAGLHALTSQASSLVGSVGAKHRPGPTCPAHLQLIVSV